jgi:O-antigen/teichoic acid export membrane protein
MSLVKKVFKNVSYLLLARTAFRFLTAFAMLYAANYLGGARYGSLETAIAWANAFLALNDLGMSQLIVREAARDEKKMAVYFGNTLAVEVVLSIVLFGAVMGVGFLANYDSLTLTLLALMSAAGLIFEFRKVMRSIFRVMMKLKFVAFLEVINGALYLLTALWIFVAVTDLDAGALGLAHARLWVNVLIVIALLAYTLKFVRPAFDAKQIWPMIKQSYVFTLYNMFFMLYFQIDQIILSLMGTSLDVGIYSAPAKVVSMLLFIPIMVFQVTMPIMYRLSEQDLPKYRRINRIIFRYLAAFGIPAGIGLSLVAEEVTTLLFTKPEYVASIPIMAVMGWFLAIRFSGLSQGNSLTTTDRQGLRAGIQVVSIVINIVLDIWLITRYGVIGAAYATLITESIITLSYLFFSARHLDESVPKNLLSLLPVGMATALMTAAVLLIKPHFHVIVSVLIGALVYLLSLWIFRFFQEQDRKIFKSIVS